MARYVLRKAIIFILYHKPGLRIILMFLIFFWSYDQIHKIFVNNYS